LRLDAARLIHAGGDDGPVVIPGNSSESPLIQHLLGTNGLKRMPPKEEGEPLAPEKIALLKAWIDAGAKAPPDEPVPENPRDHWAFRLPVKSPVPTEGDPAWRSNPIDAFLSAAHQRQGLKASAPTSQDLWLRRVYLDLVGLPPTREEWHAFRADVSPDAREKVWTGCWPVRNTAFAGAAIGWTSGVTRTGSGWARNFVSVSIISGAGGIGSSSRSTRTRL